MPQFSEKSKLRLEECHADLQAVFYRVIQAVDCTIFTGHRTHDEQERMVEQGLSKLHWPNSKHNCEPALAVDVAPYPIDWKDRERATYFAGFVLGIAASMGIKLRWGGDWNGDWQVRDNSFDDLWHFEVVNP